MAEEGDGAVPVGHSPGVNKVEDGSPCFKSEEQITLSKNQLRKQRNHERILSTRNLKRRRERERLKEKKRKKSLGNDEKALITQKLKAAMEGGPVVVVDCQYENRMSTKEQSRLAQQLRRVYASNKAANNPVNLILSSLPEQSEFYKLCCKLNDGFERYIMDRREKAVNEIFSRENSNESQEAKNNLIYLSPDSPNVLLELNPNDVYVIGGLVDETTNKNVSLRFSQSNDIRTARLPIDEYFEPDKGAGTFKKVLAVNQVFDIILKWYETKDWVQAISAGLPQRTGFRPRDKSSVESAKC